MTFFFFDQEENRGHMEVEVMERGSERERQQSMSVEEKPEREAEGTRVRETLLSELQHGRM